MATFTSDEQDLLRVVLGYASVANRLTTELTEPRSQAVVDRALALLEELSTIDGQLTAARADSMAKGVGQLQLSYSQHVSHLKGEGSRLLFELSNLIGIAILYNKYQAGRSPAIRSYW